MLFRMDDKTSLVDVSDFVHGPTLREPAPGEENEEDVEEIKRYTRFVKQDSLKSTRNAFRMAREAEETARDTIIRLGGQPLQVETCQMTLDVAKSHSERANDRTDELRQLNRLIFRPVITFNKDAKRAAQEAKVLQRHDKEREKKERYRFEATASNDELEDELDDNLDGCQELDHQNSRIERIEEKTVNLDSRVFKNTVNVRYSMH
ncbi:hypothetical protein EDB87DRAFT_1674195 [Lactarius vividus]|nr:hypothetical protein EDB87DRAFT_1674195 [Lactarius vividus]